MSCGLRLDGTGLCWGWFDDELDAPADQLEEIGVGRSFACGRRPAGTLTCWGRNDDGAIQCWGSFPTTVY